ncbi:MAG TPA: cysteine desulfurase [Legionella sp.]|nr:cysteine desulfurase [Legionella sp.]
MNYQLWRKDFPMLNNTEEDKKFIYMDNASTTLKPQIVIDAVNKFYTTYTTNISRSSHFLSEEVFFLFEQTREKIASFINAKKNEIVFTYNCTDSINLVASGLELNKNDEVILSVLEHHSNFLPWQARAQLKIIKTDQNGLIDLEHLRDQITNKTKLLSLTYLSNVTGNVQPIKEAIAIAREKGILCMVDAAQAVGHIPVDVFNLDCDFMAFSAHKMLGPSGVGVLYGKSELLEKVHPSRCGGGMANKVLLDNISYLPVPSKYEAGTLNIEGILGFNSAIDYINTIGIDNICNHLDMLESYCKTQLESTGLVTFPFAFAEDHAPIFSFRPNNPKLRIEYIANVLSDVHGIALREGYQCAQPLYVANGLDGSIRVSLYLYNTFNEIDALINALYDMRILLS